MSGDRVGVAGDPTSVLRDKSIGELLKASRRVDDEGLQLAARYQKTHHCRFGEAVVALGLATTDDVYRALSQQFHYPIYTPAATTTSPELVCAAEPYGRQAEAFRELRAQIYLRRKSRPQTIAVVSPDRGEGRTFVSVNLAVALTQLGEKTALVDADMRHPRAHGVLGLRDTSSGLSEVLAGRTNGGGPIVQASPLLPSLQVLAAGATPPNPAELLQRHAFGLLLGEFRAKFDNVIVDTPADAVGPDAKIIASTVDLVILVARASRTELRRVRQLSTTLERLGVEVGAVLLNQSYA